MDALVSSIKNNLFYSPVAASTDNAVTLPTNNNNSNATPASTFSTLGQSGQNIVGLYNSAGVMDKSSSAVILGTGSAHTAPSASVSEFDTQTQKRLNNYAFVQQVAATDHTQKTGGSLSLQG